MTRSTRVRIIFAVSGASTREERHQVTRRSSRQTLDTAPKSRPQVSRPRSDGRVRRNAPPARPSRTAPLESRSRTSACSSIAIVRYRSRASPADICASSATAQPARLDRGYFAASVSSVCRRRGDWIDIYRASISRSSAAEYHVRSWAMRFCALSRSAASCFSRLPYCVVSADRSLACACATATRLSIQQIPANASVHVAAAMDAADLFMCSSTSRPANVAE
jgi:hypothetical protein